MFEIVACNVMWHQLPFCYAVHVTDLRQTKKDRTRAAIVTAAHRLFAERGYEATTVTEIAAAAEVGTRTLFRYFATKDELLFPDSGRRVEAALDAIATREADESPADVLLRALDLAGLTRPDRDQDLDPLRLRILQAAPAAVGYALRLQWDAQQRIGRALHEAFPDLLDEVAAAAMVGAFVGAFTAATAAAAATGQSARTRGPAIRRAVSAALSSGLPA
jgi:AcrR family transcriptional regulator